MLNNGFPERCKHFGFIIIRQTTLLLRKPGLFDRQAVTALNLFGKLLSAKDLLPGINCLAFSQNAQSGHGGTHIDDSNHKVFALGVQL